MKVLISCKSFPPKAYFLSGPLVGEKYKKTAQECINLKIYVNINYKLCTKEKFIKR